MGIDKIERFRGDTHPETMTIKDDGAAIDITGATIEMTINYDTPKKITATITDAANGKVSFPFVAGDVPTAGLFKYDVQVTLSSGEISTHAKDDFELLEDITK